MANRTVVIGVGNSFRGDDAVGLEVARRLATLDLPGVTVLEQTGDGADLINAWSSADLAILVDAAVSDAEPGHVHCIEVGRDPLPTQFFRRISSHALGVAAAVQLAQALSRLPNRLTIYAIEGKRFGVGEGLSSEASGAVSQVVTAVREELARQSALESPRNT